MNTEKQGNKRGWNLAPYMFKPGQSGNPKGRTPGKSMKDYARELLNKMTDEERQEYLKGIPKEIIWKMAEGNPTDELKGSLEVSVEISEAIAKRRGTQPSTE